MMSKILSQMMIACNGAIQDEQITTLQAYKQTPLDFDYSQATYQALINIDWEAHKFVSKSEEPVEGEGTGPVDMTQQEILMSNEVEEYSDELKREGDADLRNSMGKTSLAFMDLEHMGPTTKFILFVLISGLFGAIGWYLQKELKDAKVDVNLDRKEKLRQRYEKKSK
jgi:hypothetical protein